MNATTLSIIIVSFNAEKTIERTLQSIMLQTYKNFEVIFIDGKSTDSTCTIIKKWISQFKGRDIKTKFISEPDNGVYDAMNKGAKMAEGIWCTYMNADDRYYDAKALENVMSRIDYQSDVVYGDTVFDEYGKTYLEKAKMVETIVTHLPFCPQSAFIKTNYQREHEFDTTFKISADYDFFLRAYLDSKKFHQVDVIVAVFYFGGISNRNLKQTYLEDTAVKVKNGLEKKNSIVRKCKYLYFKLKNKI